MSSNQVFTATTIAVLVLYLGVLIWTIRRDSGLLLNVNVGTALAAMIYELIPLDPDIERVVAVLLFEILAIAAAFLAWRGSRAALFWSYAVFGVHLCVSALAVFYACCVRLNRLI